MCEVCLALCGGVWRCVKYGPNGKDKSMKGSLRKVLCKKERVIHLFWEFIGNLLIKKNYVNKK